MCIVNHFRNKILCSQRKGHIIQILGRIHEKKDFIEEIFRLCAVNVMHVLDPFFSGQAMVLEDLSHIRYRWSYQAKQVLHLKTH